MKIVLMSLVLLITTACTTLGFPSQAAQDKADESSNEEGLRQARQHALLEALEGKPAQ